MRKHLLWLAVLAASITWSMDARASCAQWSKTASANATADPSINWAEGMAPSAVNDSARAMMARLAECRDDLSGVLQTAGGAVAFTVTTNQGLNAVPVDGQSIAIRLNVTNGAAPTLAADGGTAYAIQTAPGVAVGAGVLVAGTPYRVTFNLASTAWVLQSFYNNSISAGSIVTSMIADAAVTYAKIQNVAAARLLGNPTGSPAATSEISLGAGLAFVGTALTPTISPPLVPNYLSGLTLSYSSVTVFGIASGVANDSTNTTLMALASAYTKTMSSWAVGSGNGGLDTGSIGAAAWYHIYLIYRPDTAVTDVIYSLSASAPTLPTNYTLYRRIGSIKTSSSQWVSFTQVGDQFIWSASVADLSGATAPTSRTNLTLSTPLGVVTTALMRVIFGNGGGGNVAIIFTALPSAISESDQAPVVNGLADIQAASSGLANANIQRLTNTSSQIGWRATAAVASVTLNTYGWIDTRGKN